MACITLLERHIPGAKDLLQDSGFEREGKEIPMDPIPSGTEVLCVYGIHVSLYERYKLWLQEGKERRLVFIEEHPGAIQSLASENLSLELLAHPQVQLHFLYTPLQREPLARKIAWQSVFQPLHFVQARARDGAQDFQKILLFEHRNADLSLSEASDGGVALAQNLAHNRHVFARCPLALKGAFLNVPALIVGAGPSLEENIEQLALFEGKGLVLATHHFPCGRETPHFFASIDKQTAETLFRHSYLSETPFCFQARTDWKNVSWVQGEKLLFPDPSAPWMNWLYRQEEFTGMEGGWTVGNFLAAFAVFLGCSPVGFIGMDFCYSEEKKYAFQQIAKPQEGLLVEDGRGRFVKTQKDWIAGKEWMEALAKAYPDRKWVDCGQMGLEFQEPIQKGSLPEFCASLSSLPFDLQAKVHASIQQLPFKKICADRWQLWKESLQRAQSACQDFSTPLDLEGEVVFESLLQPLWFIWKEVFEREMAKDSDPIDPSLKRDLHQRLFFEQILQGHLHAVECNL